MIGLYHGGLLLYIALRLIVGGAVWWLALLDTFALFMFMPLVITLPVALLRRNRLSIMAGSLAGLIAFMWLVLPALPRATVTAQTPTIDVLTFNMLGKNPQFRQAAEWLAGSDADIIVLQEIMAEDEEPRLAPLNAPYPYQAFVGGTVRVYSKFPVVDQDILVTQQGPHGHLSLRVVLDVDGQQIALYAVHFALPVQPASHLPVDSSRFPLNFILHYDETKRNAQMRRLFAMLDAETLPHLVIGDFNMSATSVFYTQWAQRLEDAWAQAGVGWGHSWPVADVIGSAGFVPPLIRIDYIWHTPDFHTVRAEQLPRQGSDHLPLWATIALPPR